MNELLGDTSRSPSRCTVHPLRPRAHVLESVTFVLGGRLLGTFILNAPYEGSEPLRLYVVPQPNDEERTRPPTADCLISDTDLG
jgi:hypothetical protein